MKYLVGMGIIIFFVLSVLWTISAFVLIFITMRAVRWPSSSFGEVVDIDTRRRSARGVWALVAGIFAYFFIVALIKYESDLQYLDESIFALFDWLLMAIFIEFPIIFITFSLFYIPLIGFILERWNISVFFLGIVVLVLQYLILLLFEVLIFDTDSYHSRESNVSDAFVDSLMATATAYCFYFVGRYGLVWRPVRSR
ncbi:MAG: hypothetical protein ACMVY4_13600 [Minwuia sp.]|uniref:hypothetical protein n=1 Tax=Minwuia sp. TaxID=2493630 RepID=UPI003A848966